MKSLAFNCGSSTLKFQLVEVTIEGRQVQICACGYRARGASGYTVPVYFLDTALPENSLSGQVCTDYLYGRDDR